MRSTLLRIVGTKFPINGVQIGFSGCSLALKITLVVGERAEGGKEEKVPLL